MTPAKLPKKIRARQHEIFADFIKEMEIHLSEIATGKAIKMYHVKDFAERLFIHPTHLSNTIKQTTGQPPCFFFEARILAMAKAMLADNSLSIAQVAAQLTYDPSNFTKFFKHFEGITPKQYREHLMLAKFAPNT